MAATAEAAAGVIIIKGSAEFVAAARKRLDALFVIDEGGFQEALKVPHAMRTIGVSLRPGVTGVTFDGTGRGT